MDNLSLNIVIRRVLEELGEQGKSEKALETYRYCGLGYVRRFFEKNGCPQYSDNALDKFLAELRCDYEYGSISRWKWSIARRSAELLRQFATTGSLSGKPLPKWEALHNPLHAEPNDEMLGDNNSIFGLVWRTKCRLAESGLSGKTLANYGYDGFDKILCAHMDRGLTQYTPSLVDDLIAETRTRYDNGDLARSMYQDLRKAAHLLCNFQATGIIKHGKIETWNLRQPVPEFAQSIRHFCENAVRTAAIRYSTVRVTKSALRRFAFVLEDSGTTAPAELTPQIVSAAVTKLARRYDGGLSSLLSSVRIFLDFLHESGTTKTNLRSSVPELCAKRRYYRPGFTEEEIRVILSAPDRNTAIGIRDFSIMTLAAQTGLRAIDVVHLKRQNIDWRACEIRIVQEKTGKPLSLPLDAESGNAIVDYLLNARPQSELPYIFLCHSGVARPVDSRSASGYVKKYASRANVDMNTIARRGFHSFRRSFGTRLLQSEVRLELLQQLLGHADLDSAKPYLSTDEQGLKLCALGLCGIAEGGAAV